MMHIRISLIPVLSTKNLQAPSPSRHHRLLYANSGPLIAAPALAASLMCSGSVCWSRPTRGVFMTEVHCQGLLNERLRKPPKGTTVTLMLLDSSQSGSPQHEHRVSPVQRGGSEEGETKAPGHCAAAHSPPALAGPRRARPGQDIDAFLQFLGRSGRAERRECRVSQGRCAGRGDHRVCASPPPPRGACAIS